MRTILVSFQTHHATALFAAGLNRLCDQTTEALALRPVTSIREVEANEASEAPSLAAADVRPESAQAPTECVRSTVAMLASIRHRQPHLPLLVLVPEIIPHLSIMLRRLQVEEVPLNREEKPKALAVRLAKKVLPCFVREFLLFLPDDVDPNLWLGVARLVLNAEKVPEPLDLACWCCCDLETVRQALREVGIEAPASLCLWARLYRVFVRVEQLGEPIEAASEMLGFPTHGVLNDTCLRLTGQPSQLLAQEDGSTEILRCLSGAACRARTSAVRIRRKRGRPSRNESPAQHALPKAGLEPNRAVDRDIDRFAEIYQRFWHDVRTGSKRRGVSDADADDAAQEVFRKLWQRGGQAWQREFTRAYFQRAGWNQAHDFQSKWQTDRRMATAVDRDPPETQMEKLERESLVEEVRHSAEALGEPRRTIFRLCELEGWKVREVAKLLGKTIKSVEHQRARARRQVRDSGLE